MYFLPLLFLSILSAPLLTTASKRAQKLLSTSHNSTACDFEPNDLNQRVFVELAPLNRVVSTHANGLNQICTVFEFRGYLHVYYTTKEGKTECHTIGLDLKSPVAQQHQSGGVNRSNLESTKSENTTELNLHETDENQLNTDQQPDVYRFLTTVDTCCTKDIRCFSIPLSNGSSNVDPLADWHLFFTWLRTPESYEFGEEGWSSVGAPIGSLSGVYDLVRVHLVYVLRSEAGFRVNTTTNAPTFVVSSDAIERFQARVGDYYECTSTTDIVMTGANVTNLNTVGENNITRWYPLDASWKPGLQVVLSLTDVRAQAFADVNLPEFTGVGLLCVQDNSQDSTMSIAIGLSICALVLLILLGLAMSHLRDKDRSFKVVENME